MNTIWSEDTQNYDEIAAAYEELMDGIEITCTAHYTDGTSASQIITISGKVMTNAEAGLYDDDVEYSMIKDAFFVFRLKGDQ